MENSFFEETAEDLVNRLFDEIPTKNYLPKNFFSPIPELKFKSILIEYLESFDNDNQKELDKHHSVITGDPDSTELEKSLLDNYWEEYFKNQREQFILHNIIKAMYYNPPNGTNKPPEYTHCKESQKPNHLRLVVKNG